MSSISYHQFVCSLHFVGENGPSDQWPDPLPAGISKENRERQERAYQRAMGKVPLGANEPKLSNKQKRLHSAEPGETEEEIEAANGLLSLQGNLEKDMGDFIGRTEDHDDETHIQVNFADILPETLGMCGKVDKSTTTSELEAADTLVSFGTGMQSVKMGDLTIQMIMNYSMIMLG